MTYQLKTHVTDILHLKYFDSILHVNSTDDSKGSKTRKGPDQSLEVCHKPYKLYKAFLNKLIVKQSANSFYFINF